MKVLEILLIEKSTNQWGILANEDRSRWILFQLHSCLKPKEKVNFKYYQSTLRLCLSAPLRFFLKRLSHKSLNLLKSIKKLSEVLILKN